MKYRDHVAQRHVRKFKVERNGDVITKFYWKNIFWFFGIWVPYHNIAGCNDAYAKEFIRKIDEFIYTLENR